MLQNFLYCEYTVNNSGSTTHNSQTGINLEMLYISNKPSYQANIVLTVHSQESVK